jgi:hypothetical protein
VLLNTGNIVRRVFIKSSLRGNTYTPHQKPAEKEEADGIEKGTIQQGPLGNNHWIPGNLNALKIWGQDQN